MNQKIMGIIAGVLIALVAIGALGFVYAQQSGNRTNINSVKGSGFVDLDDDGVCDNISSCKHNNNSTGGCNKNRQGEQNGARFIDVNNNGICDRMESGVGEQGDHNLANCPMRNK